MLNKLEIWKPVNGWPNYHVSNFGRVRSIMNGNMYLLNLKPDKKGYIKVRLYDTGRNKIFGIHQLVAIHFKRKPLYQVEVHHKDGNKTNNFYTNLQWITRKKHIEVSIKETAFGKGQKGDKHGMAKLNNNEVFDIRKMYSSGGYSYSQLAKAYLVTKTSIYRIVNKINWAHL